MVTAQAPSGASGMTTNALRPCRSTRCCCSACFDNEARTLPVVREAGRFAVNVLSAGQEGVAGAVRLQDPGRAQVQGRRALARARRAGPRRRAGVAGLRPARTTSRRRPRDRNRRGRRDRPRRGRAAGLVRGPTPPVPSQASRPRAPQRQEHDHQRGERHHPELAAHDREHDRRAARLGERADGLRVGGPRASRPCRPRRPQLLGDERRRRAAAARRA